MDWSVFFDFLGAGGGLMVLLKWLSDLPFVRLRLKGEREDAFREMLEKDSRLIDELHGEVLQLKERFYAQEACLEKLVLCPLYDRCPARRLVQEYKRKYYYPPVGQSRVGQKGKRYPRDNPTAGGDSVSRWTASVSCPAGQPIQREADRRPSASPSERVT